VLERDIAKDPSVCLTVCSSYLWATTVNSAVYNVIQYRPTAFAYFRLWWSRPTI